MSTPSRSTAAATPTIADLAKSKYKCHFSLSLSSSVNKDELHLTDPKTKVQSPNKVVTPALVHWEREPMYLGIWRRPHLKPIF